MNRTLLCFAVLASLSASHAQNAPSAFDPFAPPVAAKPGSNQAETVAPRVYYRLLLEVIVVPKADAFEMISKESSGPDLFHQATERVSQGRGRIEYLGALITRSGTQGRLQSADELTYGTEFEGRQANGISLPAAFESTNLGDAVEAELTPGADPKQVKTHLKLHRQNLHNFQDYAYPAGGPPIAQPQFQAQELDHQFEMSLGEEHYLGTWNPSAGKLGEASECWLAFARVDQLDLEPSEEANPPPAAGWTVECSIYSVDRAVAWKFLDSASTVTDAPNPQKLRREKSAQFEGMLAMPLKAELRSMAEEILAFPYPRNYEAGAEVAANSTRTVRTVETEVTPAEGDAGKEGKGQRTSRVRETTTHGIEPAVPPRLPGMFTKYEQRQLGRSLEINAGEWRDGALEARITLKDSENRGPFVAAGTAAVLPKLPRLEDRVTESDVLLVPNRPMLFGTFSEPGADGANDRTDSGRTWIAFLQLVSNER